MGFFEPQTETVELYQGGWKQRLVEAAEAVQRAATAADGLPKTLGDPGSDPEVDRLSQAYSDLRDQAIAEGIVRVTVQALPRDEWDELIAAHPPRTSEDVNEAVRKGDEALGVNELTLSRALVPACIVKIEPEMDLEELLAGVNSGQFEEIYAAAYRCNRGSGFNPKEAPALTPSPSSSGTEN